MALLTGGAWSPHTIAQDTPAGMDQRRESVLSYLWGAPSPNAIYLGTWSHHFNEESRRNNRQTNHLVGLSYNGYYAGTFLNSNNDRVWSAGVQRTLASSQLGAVNLSAGYRLGLMHGYDERLTSLAGKTPLFPILQLTLDATVKNVGVQLSWAGSVVTAGFTYHFR